MVLLTTNVAQTLTTGQSLTFNILRQTGCSEKAAQGSSTVLLKQNGIYLIDFTANVTTDTATTLVILQLYTNGVGMADGVMQSTITAANDIQNVAASTAINTRAACGFGASYSVSVTNPGPNPVTIYSGANLRIVRVG